ncbi:MAG TPA: HNH endonuclease [Erysipelotrichaceae bacterium]|nr:HNH endonuclease [Erysipelotrichaceae bacterium]
MAKYQVLSEFYKSPEWINLRKQLMLERSSTSRGLLCEICHEPILRDIECIGHHIQELTPQNVNDVQVSLNPRNILLVHHRCHNALHERFGQTMLQRVYIVYGPPLSGKTSFVRNNKGRKDLVLDLDELYQAITLLPAYDKPTELKMNVFQIRDELLDQMKIRMGKWQNAWIIGGYSFQLERQRLAIAMGAELFFVEATKEECLRRLFEDKDKLPFQTEWHKYIHVWFLAFRPDSLSVEMQDDRLGPEQGTMDARKPRL